MKKYVWAWADGEDNYINEAENLSDILNEVLEYYSCDYKYFKIDESGERFLIQIDTDEQSHRYEIQVNPSALTEFLNHQAGLVDRPDKFDIWSKST
jgi:hypothetical protein